MSLGPPLLPRRPSGGHGEGSEWMHKMDGSSGPGRPRPCRPPRHREVGWPRVAAAAAALSLMLSGCWDITTPEHLLVPTLLAVDWRQGQYQVTLQSVLPAQSNSGSGGATGGEMASVSVLTGHGTSLMSALYQTGINVPLRATLTHIQAVVIGDETLRPRILSGIVDALLRDPGCPHTFYLLAARGEAAPLAAAASSGGLYPAQTLIEQEHAADALGHVQAVRFDRWFPHFINAPYEASMLPVVAVDTSAGSRAAYQFEGEAVIVHGALHGMLAASRTALWVLASHPAEYLFLPHPQMTVSAGATPVTFRVDRHRAAVRWRDGRIVLDEHVTVSLIEIDGQQTPHDAPPLQGLSGRLSSLLTGRTLALMTWSQRHHADMFQIGDSVRARHPAWMREHEAEWPAVYSRAPLTVHVSVTVANVGTLR